MTACQLCGEEEATEGNYCLKCDKIVNDAIQDKYLEKDESIIIGDREFGKHNKKVLTKSKKR